MAISYTSKTVSGPGGDALQAIPVFSDTPIDTNSTLNQPSTTAAVINAKPAVNQTLENKTLLDNLQTGITEQQVRANMAKYEAEQKAKEDKVASDAKAQADKEFGLKQKEADTKAAALGISGTSSIVGAEEISPETVHAGDMIKAQLTLGNVDENTIAANTGLTTDQIKGYYNTKQGAIDYQNAQQIKKQNDLLDSYQNGTLPLTPAQQAQVDNLKKQFDELKKQQEIANKNYQGGIDIAGLVSGRSRYATEIQGGIAKQAVDDGIAKIQKIDTEMASAVSKMTQSFQDGNYKVANEASKQVQSLLKERQTELDNTNKTIADANKDLRDFNYKAEQDYIKNQLASDKLTLDEKNALADRAIAEKKLSLDEWKAIQDVNIEREKLQAEKDKSRKTLAIAGLNPDDPDYMNKVLEASAGGKTVDVTTRQQITKSITALGQLGDLEKAISKTNTGPILGILKSANPWDTKAQLIKAQLQAMVPNLARGVYGEIGVLTDNDVALYTRTIPNLKSTNDVNKAILAMTLRTIQRSVETQFEVAAGTGLDVSGLKNVWDRIKTKTDELNKEIGINPEDDKLSSAMASASPEKLKAVDAAITENPDLTEAEILYLLK